MLIKKKMSLSDLNKGGVPIFTFLEEWRYLHHPWAGAKITI